MARAASQSGSPDASCRVVILYGPETFLRSLYTDELRDALKKVHGGVGVFRFDGKIASPADVLDECRSFGLMDPHKLVIVDDADVFLRGGAKEEEDDDDESSAAASSPVRKLMEKYAQAPSECATLVLRADKWRSPNLDKVVATVGRVIECQPPNRHSAAAWAVARAKRAHGLTISPDIAAALVERAGTDMGRLDTELAKLAASTFDGTALTVELISAVVGRSHEEEVWGIQETLLKRSPAAALAHVREVLDSREAPQLVLWAMIDVARKLHACSAGARQGTPPGAISSAMRLWGPTAGVLLDVGARVRPDAAADLLHRAITADRRAKSGLGDPVRNVELLALSFASVRDR